MEKNVNQVEKIILSLPTTECYNTNEHVHTLRDLEPEFRKIIESRIEHCYNSLLENKDKAVATCSGQIVCWKGGHFSYPIYQELVKSREKDIMKWSAIIWQQIIRQMALDKNNDMELMNVATEMLLCSDKRTNHCYEE